MQASTTSTAAAVIVAAGQGRRAGGEIAKQWQEVAGARVIDHTLDAFRAHARIEDIVLVLHPDASKEHFDGIRSVTGGQTRAASVRAGLAALEPAAPGLVLIHDVARPCVPAEIIDAVIDALAASDGAAPALPVTDALWHGAEGRVTGLQAREGLFRAQTPQGFDLTKILAAHASAPADAADDVAIALAAGLDVAIVPGSEDNLKITYPPDFARAADILERRHGHQARQRI